MDVKRLSVIFNCFFARDSQKLSRLQNGEDGRRRFVIGSSDELSTREIITARKVFQMNDRSFDFSVVKVIKKLKKMKCESCSAKYITQ